MPEDLVILVMANAGVIAGAAPGAWRRFAAYMTQAFSASSGEPLPAPPAPDAIYRACCASTSPAKAAAAATDRMARPTRYAGRPLAGSRRPPG